MKEEYKPCPAIIKQKAHYSPINPNVVVCEIAYCPYDEGKKIYWEAEEVKICNGRIKKDLIDKINSFELFKKSNQGLQSNSSL